MRFLDRLGKRAMDALYKGVERAGKVRKRVQPFIDAAPLPDALRERLGSSDGSNDEPSEKIREPEQNRSPFVKPAAEKPSPDESA